MTADVELLPCGQCGMPCRPGEYHPYAACLMFKTCRNSDTVRGNLQDAQDHATAAKDAEVEALRADVAAVKESLTAELRLVRGERDRAMQACETIAGHLAKAEARAERLAEEVEALRAEVERLTFEMGCLRQHYDERTACMIVHRGSALACSAAVRAAYSEEHERAERLAEALRDAADDLERGIDARIVVAQARAALRDQGEG